MTAETDPEQSEATGRAAAGGGGGEPSEEEMRAALEEQLRQLRVEDLLLQSVASIVNLTARRIAKPDERDLGQARTGIDAVAALSELLPEEAASQIRNALSELQMLYAQAVGEGSEEPSGAPSGDPPPGGSAGGESQPKGSDPPPRLWTPGS